MPSPFPGMDPYLEDPAIWSGVYAAILGAIFERLGPAVRPKYLVRYEERVYVTSEEDPGYRVLVPDVRIIEREPSPLVRQSAPAGGLAITEPVPVTTIDDEIHEHSLKVIDVQDRTVVTVIELLSPTNKTANSFGRESFLKKRREILKGDASWIEIDLLRGGERVSHLSEAAHAEYMVYLLRGGPPRKGFVWPISIRQRLPVIAVPLRGTDPDVPLDLQTILNLVVERGSYDLDFDYSREPVPPLAPNAADWARRVIHSAQGNS
jgi:hypothetical protein